MRALLLLAALPSLAAAEPRQHGDLILDLSDAWSGGSADERGLVTYFWDGPEEACELCRLIVGPPEPASGDLADWLAGQAPRFVDPDDAGTREVTSPAEAIADMGRPFAMQGQTVDRDVQVVMALEAGGRRTALAFQGWAYDQEEVERSMAFLQSDIIPILEGLRFVSEGAAPLMPAAEPGGLDGLWWGWSTGLMPGADGVVQMKMNHRHIAFWPDGRFYDGTPPGGLAPLDKKGVAGTDWGTYRERGGSLVLSYADGRTETLRAEDGGWTDDAQTLRQVQPLPDGTPVEGTLESLAVSGAGFGELATTVAAGSTLVFAPDGTYGGESFGGGLSAAVTTFSESERAGTYAVRDGLLVRTPSDGSEPVAEWIYDSGDRIMIGEGFLE